MKTITSIAEYAEGFLILFSDGSMAKLSRENVLTPLTIEGMSLAA